MKSLLSCLAVVLFITFSNATELENKEYSTIHKEISPSKKFRFIDSSSYAFLSKQPKSSLESTFLKEDFNLLNDFSALNSSVVRINLKNKNHLSLGIHTNSSIWIFSQFNFELVKYIHGPKLALVKVNIKL